MSMIGMPTLPTKLLAAAALAAIPAAGHAGDAIRAAAAASAAVEIKNLHFVPETLTIAAGTTVTWKNDDGNPHTVTDRGRVFRSAGLDTGDTFSYTFATPGEFTYSCTIHPMMVGRIVVTAAGKSS
jgi:plastocyanin